MAVQGAPKLKRPPKILVCRFVAKKSVPYMSEDPYQNPSLGLGICTLC